MGGAGRRADGRPTTWFSRSTTTTMVTAVAAAAVAVAAAAAAAAADWMRTGTTTTREDVSSCAASRPTPPASCGTTTTCPSCPAAAGGSPRRLRVMQASGCGFGGCMTAPDVSSWRGAAQVGLVRYDGTALAKARTPHRSTASAAPHTTTTTTTTTTTHPQRPSDVRSIVHQSGRVWSSSSQHPARASWWQPRVPRLVRDTSARSQRKSGTCFGSRAHRRHSRRSGARPHSRPRLHETDGHCGVRPASTARQSGGARPGRPWRWRPSHVPADHRQAARRTPRASAALISKYSSSFDEQVSRGLTTLVDGIWEISWLALYLAMFVVVSWVFGVVFQLCRTRGLNAGRGFHPTVHARCRVLALGAAATLAAACYALWVWTQSHGSVIAALGVTARQVSASMRRTNSE